MARRAIPWVLVLVGVAAAIVSALLPIPPYASTSGGWFGPATTIAAVVLCLISVASLPNRAGRAYLAAFYSLAVAVAVRANPAAQNYLVVVAIAALVVPSGVILALRLADVPVSRPWFIATTSMAGLAAVLGTARALVYDPFHDPDCHFYCARRSPLLRSNTAVAEYLGNASSAILLAASGAAVVTLTRSTRVSRRPHVNTIARVGALTVVVLSAFDVVVRMTQSAADAPETISRSVQAARVVTVGICAITLAARAIERAVLRRRLRRVATWLETDVAPTDVEQHLRRALGDDSARVVYPTEAGGFVDNSGSTVRTDDDTLMTELTVAGDVVAFIAHRGSPESNDIIADQLGQRARLAIYNEGIRMQLERNVRELREARLRFLEATTSARLRLERDLHDGAQQRILAVVFELRRSERCARRAGCDELADALLSACEFADQSVEQLRRVAHGVHPHLLTSDGLETALLSLTDTSQQPMSLRVALSDAVSSDLEYILYSIVSDIVARSTQDGHAAISDVEITSATDCVYTAIHGSQIVVSDDVIDRIDAAGGCWARGPAEVTVELPCGS